MCKVNTGIVRLYTLVMQGCTLLLYKIVHSCITKVYNLISAYYQLVMDLFPFRLSVRFHLEFTAYLHQIDCISYHILCFLHHCQVYHTYSDTACLALDAL